MPLAVIVPKSPSSPTNVWGVILHAERRGTGCHHMRPSVCRRGCQCGSTCQRCCVGGGGGGGGGDLAASGAVVQFDTQTLQLGTALQQVRVITEGALAKAVQRRVLQREPIVRLIST